MKKNNITVIKKIPENYFNAEFDKDSLSENEIFEKRTKAALKGMDKKVSKAIPSDEFLKELESW